MTYKLSKSKYCSALQCPKMLWLKENKPEEFNDSCINQAVMNNGSSVGNLAIGLFGESVDVPFGDLTDMVAETKRLIDKQTPVITEASFFVEDLFCSVDILKCTGDGEVEIYEVKSSTSVHEHYYDDAAFQCYVVTKAGYCVKKCSVVHINNQYVRQGELNLQVL